MQGLEAGELNILLNANGHALLTDFDLSYCSKGTYPELIKNTMPRKVRSLQQHRRGLFRWCDQGIHCKAQPCPCLLSLAGVDGLGDAAPQLQYRAAHLPAWALTAKCIRQHSVRPSRDRANDVGAAQAHRYGGRQSVDGALAEAKMYTLKAEPQGRANSFVGTEEYLAPEIINGTGHSRCCRCSQTTQAYAAYIPAQSVRLLTRFLACNVRVRRWSLPTVPVHKVFCQLLMRLVQLNQ